MGINHVSGPLLDLSACAGSLSVAAAKNAMIYGPGVTPLQILHGSVAPPHEMQPLYAMLNAGARAARVCWCAQLLWRHLWTRLLHLLHLSPRKMVARTPPTAALPRPPAAQWSTAWSAFLRATWRARPPRWSATPRGSTPSAAWSSRRAPGA